MTIVTPAGTVGRQVGGFRHGQNDSRRGLGLSRQRVQELANLLRAAKRCHDHGNAHVSAAHGSNSFIRAQKIRYIVITTCSERDARPGHGRGGAPVLGGGRHSHAANTG